MANRRVLFTALMPVLLLLGLMLSLRLVSSVPNQDSESLPVALPSLPPRPYYKPHPADAKTQALLTSVVSGQLKAIRAKDWKLAQTFSATPFRLRVTPEKFGTMIADLYPSMQDWTKIEYATGFVMREAEVDIMATLTRENGLHKGYHYTLTKESDGWRVEACTPVDLLPRQSPTSVPVEASTVPPAHP